MSTRKDEHRVTWEGDIKGLFTPDDISGMKSRGLDLSSYFDVKSNWQLIQDSISSGHMSPGSPWGQNKIDLFKTWKESGYPKDGGDPAPPTPTPAGEATCTTIYKYVPERHQRELPSLDTWPEKRIAETGSLDYFSNSVDIKFQLPIEANGVSINIWNRFGLEVRNISIASKVRKGRSKVNWNGIDDNGKKVHSGIFIYRITVDGTSDSGSFYLATE
jgi:hypothetical protein